MTRLWTDYLKEVENPVKVTFKNGTAIKIEKDTIPNVCGDFYCRDSEYTNKLADELYHQMWTTEIDEIISTFRKCHNDIMEVNDSTKEKKDMLTITNYKYDEKTATTTIFWSDKSQSSVTADSDAEANEFTGFCAACAKKLFGNKSTYLNQFDKWTVKIPAKQKAEAEKKAAEDKLNAEAQAKKAAKRAERKKKREVEKRAKEIADKYYKNDVEREAEKMANEKYGVPKSYLGGSDDGYDEFDTV